MKRFFILLLILLLAGAWLGQLMVQDPGYVLLAYKETTIETSLWVLLLMAIIAFAVLHTLINLIARARTPARRMRSWRGQRNQRIAQNKTLKGLMALSEGNWWKAQRYLTRAAERSEQPLINYLAAAKAAHEQGDASAADNLLQKAREATPKAEVAIGIVQAQIQLARGQNEPALATLLHLKQLAPKHSYVLKLLKETYLRLNDWPGLNQLLPEIKRHQALPTEQIRKLENLAAQNLLKQSLSNQPAEADSKTRLQAVAHTWQSLPPDCTHDQQLIEQYSALMIEAGSSDEAEKMLREQIRRNWDEKLVALYGRIITSTPHKQLETAKGWLKKHEESPALELTLGRLSMQNQHWGAAIKHFERSIELQPGADAYAELGRLLNHLGERERAAAVATRGFELVNGSLPSLPLPAAKSEPLHNSSD
ncbi:heme biosynthesis protein HemY [Marinobacterium sp. D7]|uniref:heme biosynthesis HemY N-terminal domain-containing protein n=1 Tax=Marinobacterium ramblicola TaxID=2849041 RepID=UPI001C2CF53F|nr:heme biosynthesis HemY N-terminal domain-containing protein [Marinobacterium ramblicola]MBV1787882.1 heme biosynthesis protein HemY [Marinobacterium ramblicola]